MKTKYDWSNAPKEVKWIAIDDLGFQSGFTDEPKMELKYGFWDNGLPSYRMGYSEFKGNWQDSLEERPK